MQNVRGDILHGGTIRPPTPVQFLRDSARFFNRRPVDQRDKLIIGTEHIYHARDQTPKHRRPLIYFKGIGAVKYLCMKIHVVIQSMLPAALYTGVRFRGEGGGGGGGGIDKTFGKRYSPPPPPPPPQARQCCKRTHKVCPTYAVYKPQNIA